MNSDPPAENEGGPRFTLSPRWVLRQLSLGHAHRCVAKALQASGCRVRYIQRLDGHPVWRISLASPWPFLDPQSRRFKNFVKKALRQVDSRCPVQDLDVDVVGNRLMLLFVWETLAPGGVLAIQPTRTDFLRQRDDGSWDSWKIEREVALSCG